MSNDLSPAQKRIYDRLALAGYDIDVDIVSLYLIARPVPIVAELYPTSREQQQYVGSFIAPMNVKIKEQREAIEPGQVKRTYRLTRTAG